ncbi:RNA polymerase sigma factor [Maribacter sp. ACAM166]|uniref:RNA polymerase sigma factor n=1 Tax=Maribacter sp. ACAM166 TaxID=2508996 RepID=UPI0010FEDDAF|nr:sigma-70 family RNA polymerase sigma factor [Maribacter sp. ACAM166]TLP74145.1 sigma-70 family RNA polymerase sigma factor [Maribacter sp. ACAM166]
MKPTKMDNANQKLCIESDSEKEIWLELRRGDPEALGNLYDLYVDQLFAIGMKTIGSRDLVQDHIHDLFLDLYKYHEHLAEVRSIAGYLITSFKRKLYKQNKFQITHLRPNWDDNNNNIPIDLKVVNSHEEQLIQQEHKDERSSFLKRALTNLTEHQQNILILRFTEEKSYDEIADIMSVSVSSARTLIYRAVKTIRNSTLSIFL